MSDLIPDLHRGQIDANAVRQVVLIAAGILTIVVFERLYWAEVRIWITATWRPSRRCGGAKSKPRTPTGCSPSAKRDPKRRDDPAAAGRAGRQARRTVVRANRVGHRARVPDPREVERGLTWFQRIGDPNVVLHRLEQEENKAEAEYDELMARLSDPADRRIAEEAMLEERDHAVVLRTLAGGKHSDAAVHARHHPAPRALASSAAPAGLATPSTASTTAWARSSASSRAWPATPAAAKSSWPPAWQAPSRARSRWAPARTSRRNPNARCTNRKSRANGPEIEEDPHEEMLELELFYQLKGFSAEESRAHGGTNPARSRNSFCERWSRKNSASPRRRFRTPGVRRSPPPSRPPSAGSSRSSRSSSPSACRRSMASFIISTLAHFAVGASKVAGHDAAVVGQRRRDDLRRRHRGGGHVRPRAGVRPPLSRASSREDIRASRHHAHHRRKQAFPAPPSWHSDLPQ